MNFKSTDYVITCSLENKKGTVLLPYYKGELKHFFSNYKDYYYLPMEDTAIHKSVAEYVEKEYRKKATKETCYIKKDSLFLPQLEIIFSPEFQFDYKDKLYWFESTNLGSVDSDIIGNYFVQLLSLYKLK